MDKIKQIMTVICMVLATALFCIPTVSAGSMNAGDSFDTATEIEPGYYEDEITLVEEKYSYIVLKPGQELVFELTSDKIYGGDYGHIDVAVFDEDRSQITRVEVEEANTKPFHFSTSSKKDSYKFYIKIDLIHDSGRSVVNADYHTSISIEDHFDANSETDAGDTFNDAFSISPGNYKGYLSPPIHRDNSGNDMKDYFKLSMQSGDKLTVAVTPSDDASLILAIFNEDRESVKVVESKEAGAIARSQWLADSSQDIYILVKGKLSGSTAISSWYDGGEYSLDITTGKAPAHKPRTTSGSESESESEEQPGFVGIIAIISLAGVYIGLRKK